MNRTSIIFIVIFAVLALIALGFIAYPVTRDLDNGQGDTPAETPDTGNEVGDDGDEEAALAETVDVYVVDLEAAEEGEGIGCGDELVAITRDIEPTAGVLVAALEELFSLTSDDTEYYSALTNSDLSVESATVEDGLATVEIAGEVSVGGVCDDPRFEEQIRQTVMQFSTVDEANISINGTLLEDFFDAQGE